MPRHTASVESNGADGEDTGGGGRGRALWSGTLSFGLVSIPVELYSASRSTRVSARMLAPDGTPLQRRYFCPAEDKPLERDELARGFEIDDGKFVVVTDEELERLEPEKSRDIDLQQFVPADQVDPLYFEHAYFLVPGEGAGKAYGLLVDTMAKTKRAGIATFVMREHEQLVALFPKEGVIEAVVLRFAEEVRPIEALEIDVDEKIDKKAIARFTRIIKKGAAKTVPAQLLTDTRTKDLEKLIEAKHQQHDELVSPVPPAALAEPGAEVIDLAAALRASLGGPTPARRAGPVRSDRTRPARPRRAGGRARTRRARGRGA